MSTKTAKQLSLLNDEKLFAYFSRHAQYHKHSPSDSKYSIRVGMRAYFAGDTKELYDKFVQKVRASSPEPLAGECS